MAWLGERAADNWYWVSIGVFLLAAFIEALRPDHRVRRPILGRWLPHMAVYAAGLVLSSAALPAFYYALTIDRSHSEATGLFGPVQAWAGPWAVLAAGLIGIDLLVYWAHRLEHRVTLLWRFHAVHHADPEMDVSTALLHHPIAYVFTAGLVGCTMLTAGLPAWVFPVYALFEITAGVFQHVATPIPDGFERRIRWLLVTPGMHQAHHSADPSHYDTNFANVFSVWDRVFGTYLALDASARNQIEFGIAPDRAGHGLLGILTRPVRIASRSAHARAPQAIEQA